MNAIYPKIYKLLMLIIIQLNVYYISVAIKILLTWKDMIYSPSSTYMLLANNTLSTILEREFRQKKIMIVYLS